MQTEILAKLFEVIFPVFFIIGMGYVFGKKIQILIQMLLLDLLVVQEFPVFSFIP